MSIILYLNLLNPPVSITRTSAFLHLSYLSSLLFHLSLFPSSLSLFASPSHSFPHSLLLPSLCCNCETCAVPLLLLSSTTTPPFPSQPFLLLLLFLLHLLRTIGPAVAYGCLSHAMRSGLLLLELSELSERLLILYAWVCMNANVCVCLVCHSVNCSCRCSPLNVVSLHRYVCVEAFKILLWVCLCALQ